MAWLLTWLVHGLAVALMARLLVGTRYGVSAATRYAIWWAALVLVLLLPVMRTVSVGGIGPVAENPAVAESEPVAKIRPVAQPLPVAQIEPVAHAGSAAQTEPVAEIGPVATISPADWLSGVLPSLPVPPVPRWVIAIAIGAWLGFAMLGLLQVAYSVQVIRRLKASCHRLIEPRVSQLPLWCAVRRRGRPAQIKTSDRVRTAAVLGLVRPVIVVPRNLSASLTPQEVDQVVLHEYAHVQRYDDWTKLLQVLIRAFFGWHPAVRLMLREIDFEREAACDDWVVEMTGAPRAYARCLTKMAARAPGTPLAVLPCASRSSGHTLSRIERLLDRRRPSSSRLAPVQLMTGAAVLTVLAFCTVHAIPVAIDMPHPASASAMSAARMALRGPAGDAARLDPIGPTDSIANVARAMGLDAASPDKIGARRPETVTTPAAITALAIADRATTRTDRTGANLIAVDLTAADPTAADRTGAAQTGAARTGAARTGADRTDAARTAAPATREDARRADATFLMAGMLPSALSLSLPSAALRPLSPRPQLSEAQSPQPQAVRAQSPSAYDSHNSPLAEEPAPAHLAFAPDPLAAADAAVAAATDAGHIEKAWDATRGATSRGVSVGARAAGSATKTATTKAADGVKTAATNVKDGSAKAARFIGRLPRTLNPF